MIISPFKKKEKKRKPEFSFIAQIELE